jgi:hypothetical protein
MGRRRCTLGSRGRGADISWWTAWNRERCCGWGSRALTQVDVVLLLDGSFVCFDLAVGSRDMHVNNRMNMHFSRSVSPNVTSHYLAYASPDQHTSGHVVVCQMDNLSDISTCMMYWERWYQHVLNLEPVRYRYPVTVLSLVQTLNPCTQVADTTTTVYRR